MIDFLQPDVQQPEFIDLAALEAEMRSPSTKSLERLRDEAMCLARAGVCLKLLKERAALSAAGNPMRRRAERKHARLR